MLAGVGCDKAPSTRSTEPLGAASGETGGSGAQQPDPSFDGGADVPAEGSTTSGAVQTDGASQGAQDPSDTDTSSGTTVGQQESSGGSSESGDSSDDSDREGSSTGGSTGALLEPIDVSGWTVVQTDSPRELTLPEGTIIEPGGTLVIARDASRPAFEDWWGETMEGTVVFIDGENNFPVINGDETFTLRDAMGATIDGPTPALALGGNLQREQSAADGWLTSMASTASATPGVSQTTQAGGALVVITEVSDAPGNGTFAYEFVELAFVAP